MMSPNPIINFQISDHSRLFLPDSSNFLSAECEIVRDSHSIALDQFYDLLGREFGEAELEPKKVFEREISDGTCICVLAKVLASAAYGSVHIESSGNGAFLAIRFTLTEASLRSSGISQIADEELIRQAQTKCSEFQKPLNYLICEAVNRSESYWNNVKITPDGSGMKRIFSPEGEEIYYKLPPLEWNEDGTPVADGAREHLMITGQNSISTETLVNILRPWWQSWYVRPASDFMNLEAFELHKATVQDVLENQIIAKLPNVKELNLYSKIERLTKGLLCYDEG